MNILQWLSQTDSGVVGLILRIVLAVVMFPHGAQKTLGWFGGHGFRGSHEVSHRAWDSRDLRAAGDYCRIPRFSRPRGRALTRVAPSASRA